MRQYKICDICGKKSTKPHQLEGCTVCAKCYNTFNPPRIKTEAQFRKHCRNVAQDTINDMPDIELDQVACDLADNMLYDPDVKRYVLKAHPWIKTKTQWREFVADYIVA